MQSWHTSEKIIWGLSVVMSFLGVFAQMTLGMHIMEGYLPLVHCLSWGAVCIPFLTAGMINLRRRVKHNRRLLVLLAMSGAYVFVISSLKIPSFTGSSSHMTGTGLSAIILGPLATGILGLIVLVFQALLLAHGGISTLGANTFSMAIAGPIFSFSLYYIGKKMKLPKKVNIFVAAALGDLFTYTITGFQLALAYPTANGSVMASFLKFMAVFAPTQLPLAVIEGILTVIIVIGMESFARPELQDVGFLDEVA